MKTSLTHFQEHAKQTAVHIHQTVTTKLNMFVQGTVDFTKKTKDTMTNLFGKLGDALQEGFQKVALGMQQTIDWIVANKEKILNGLKKVGIVVLEVM